MIAHLVLAELRMLAVLTVGYCLALIVHEAGHAAMILAVRFDLRLIRFGTGPLLLRTRIGRAWLVVRAFPIHAYVMMLPPPPGRRGSQIAVTAAGALANAAAILVLAAAALVWRASFEIALLLALGQACVIVGVLVPSYGRFGGARLPSDGLRIWHLLTRPGYSTLPALHATLMQDVLLPGETPPPPSAASGEIAYQVLRPDRLADPWAAQDAAQAIRHILHHAALPPLERAFVLSFLALSEVLFGNTGATAAELDDWSLQALELSDAPLPLVIRGGVLVRFGRFDAAASCLSQIEPVAVAGIQPVLVKAFLARALGGQGHAPAARLALAQARAAVPPQQVRVMQPILAQIERYLAAAPAMASV